MGIKDWFKRNVNTIKNIISVFTIISSIGFWGFFASVQNIHWSHKPVISNIYSDYEIRLENPKYNNIYSIGDPFKITFILSNTWTQPLDVEFDISVSTGITANYSCNSINEECPKSPDLNKNFFFKDLQRPQYITVKGIFNNDSEDASVCLLVNEPGFHENSEQRCERFSPSGLKK